jgi:DNA replication protein DnaC
MTTSEAIDNVVILQEQKELVEKAYALELGGIAEALEDQFSNPAIFGSMTFEDRLGRCLRSQEETVQSQKFENLYDKSNIRRRIYLNQLSPNAEHGLTEECLALFAETSYIRQFVNIVINGPAGVGKSALAIAAAIEAMKKGYSVRYFRMMEFAAVIDAKTENAFSRFKNQLYKVDLLILDDMGGSILTDSVAIRFNEIIDARYNAGSTIITSQLKKDSLKEIIPEGPIRGAVTDRLFRKNDIEIRLKGSSWRGQPLEIKGIRTK